jgi:peptidoglycan/xylan/chitin deacetylase (PgdA/CDA1 family)
VRTRLVLSLAGALAAAAVLSAVAGASKKPPAPLAVQSASLTQDGQQLAWRVVLAGRFSAAGLARDHRALCLLIERPKSGAVSGELCLEAPRTGRGADRLVYSRVGAAGAGRVLGVAATITRSGAEELTATFLPTRFDTAYHSVRWQVVSVVQAAGCVPASQTLARCVTTFPARPALAKLHTPKLVGCVPSGQSLVYSGSPTVHDIALSFDDGPWGTPPTTAFINLLARYHVPATFFEIGDQISEYDPTGSVQRAMLANGDMIGDHTWTHPEMAGLPASEQSSELELTVQAIRHATGFTPCLWRPPYGDISPSLVALARSLGLLTIMWDIDPRDWSLPGVGEIEGNVITNARNGGITEMHFGGGPRYQTLDALPDIITTLKARGYRFVTISQMLGLRMIYK